jgi:hypothetical protein
MYGTPSSMRTSSLAASRGLAALRTLGQRASPGRAARHAFTGEQAAALAAQRRQPGPAGPRRGAAAAAQAAAGAAGAPPPPPELAHGMLPMPLMAGVAARQPAQKRVGEPPWAGGPGARVSRAAAPMAPALLRAAHG